MGGGLSLGLKVYDLKGFEFQASGLRFGDLGFLVQGLLRSYILRSGMFVG